MTSPDPKAGTGGEHRFEVRASAESHFSWIRTRLSVERTLMSWVRTSTALIGFGFTIVQFFERFGSMAGVNPAVRPEMPRYLGLALIAAGVVGLLASLWQYKTMLHYLDGEFAQIAGVRPIAHQTPLVAVTVAVLFIGIFAFVAVFTRAM